AHLGGQPAADLADQAGPVPPGYVDVVDGVAAGVVRAGDAELDVVDPAGRYAGAGPQLVDQVGHGRQRIGVQEVHRRLHASPDRAGQVADGGGERRYVGTGAVAHGDGHGVRRVGVGRVDLGVRAGSGTDVAHDAGQSGVGESS